MSHLLFLKEIVKHPNQIGAIAQSSPGLSRRMAQSIGSCKRVIEMGAGTGVVTKEILKHLPADGHLTSFEINPHLCECLSQIKDERFTLVHGDARECEQYDPDCECLVSELPLAIFEEEFVNQIIDIGVRIGRYVQLQYVPMMTKQLKQRFNDVRIKFVPLNIPPACFYVCQDAKAGR